MSLLPRCSPRFHPPNPITIAIEDDRRTVVAYGVMADISTGGGCIHTDVLIVDDATFNLRLSIASPPEVHTALGRIAWTKSDPECSQVTAYCCGVEWLSLGHTLRCRLRQLSDEAVRSGNRDRFMLVNMRLERVARPSPNRKLLAEWNLDTGPQTQPVGIAKRARAAGGSAPGAGHERASVLRFPRDRVKDGSR